MGTWTNEPILSRSTKARTKRWASAGSLTYDSPVRATWPIMPSPTPKRVRMLSSLKPIAATVRRSAVAGS